MRASITETSTLRRLAAASAAALLVAAFAAPAFAQESSTTSSEPTTVTSEPSTTTTDDSTSTTEEPTSTTSTSEAAGEGGNIAFVQGIPGISVDVYLDGDYSSPVLSDVAFSAAESFQLEAGTYSVEVYEAGADPNSAEPVASPSTFNVTDTSAHSIVSGLTAEGERTLYFFLDDLSATDGKTRLVVRHVADAEGLAVRLNDSTVSDMLAVSNAYTSVVDPDDAASFELRLASDTERVVLPARQLRLEADKLVTVYVVGSADASPSTLDIVAVVSDVEGSDTSATEDSTTTTTDGPQGVPTGDGSLAGDGGMLLVAAASLVALVSAGALIRNSRSR